MPYQQPAWKRPFHRSSQVAGAAGILIGLVLASQGRTKEAAYLLGVGAIIEALAFWGLRRNMNKPNENKPQAVISIRIVLWAFAAGMIIVGVIFGIFFVQHLTSGGSTPALQIMEAAIAILALFVGIVTAIATARASRP